MPYHTCNLRMSSVIQPANIFLRFAKLSHPPVNLSKSMSAKQCQVVRQHTHGCQIPLQSQRRMCRIVTKEGCQQLTGGPESPGHGMAGLVNKYRTLNNKKMECRDKNWGPNMTWARQSKDAPIYKHFSRGFLPRSLLCKYQQQQALMRSATY